MSSHTKHNDHAVKLSTMSFSSLHNVKDTLLTKIEFRKNFKFKLSQITAAVTAYMLQNDKNNYINYIEFYISSNFKILITAMYYAREVDRVTKIF